MKGPRPQPWDRVATETPKAFAAFAAYRDLPPPDRSVLAAYRVRSGRLEAENLKPPGRWYDWFERHRWEDRARSYDVARDRKIEQALRDRRLKSLEEVAVLGEGLHRKATAALRVVAGVTQRLGLSPDGSGKEVWLIETTLSASDICRFAQVGVQLESLALGFASTRVSLVNAGSDGAADLLDSAKEEMRRRLAAIRDRQEAANGVFESGVK